MKRMTDEQIWDQLGILADGDWTLADLWDHARLLGVRPSHLFPPHCSRSEATAA